MIIKPSITFLTTDTDPQLATDTETIVNSIMGNPAYSSPNPTMLEITASKGEFVVAIADAADGGITLTAIKNAKRAVLVGLLRQLASYVEVACNGNLVTLLSSGFPIQKPQRNPIGVLPAPSNLSMNFGALTGELNASAAPVGEGSKFQNVGGTQTGFDKSDTRPIISHVAQAMLAKYATLIKRKSGAVRLMRV